MSSEPDRAPESVRAYSTMYTLRALEQLALGPHSAPELAAELRVSDVTARRILQRLRVEGYAVQADGYHRRYHATLRTAAVGRQLLARASLLQLAGKWLEALAQHPCSVAGLWIPAWRDVTCVAQASPGLSATAPGPLFAQLVPAHASAAGRCILAHRPEWRRSLLDYLEGSNEETADLNASLDRIAAETIEVHDDAGRLHLAAPILERGTAVGALELTIVGSQTVDAFVLGENVRAAAVGLGADCDARR